AVEGAIQWERARIEAAEAERRAEYEQAEEILKKAKRNIAKLTPTTNLSKRLMTLSLPIDPDTEGAMNHISVIRKGDDVWRVERRAITIGGKLGWQIKRDPLSICQRRRAPDTLFLRGHNPRHR